MARYIDCENCYHGKVCAERHIYHDMIVSCPHHIPTADVEEVKHGYWIDDIQEFTTVAGVRMNGVVGYICGRKELSKEPYCNCGAKMDGGNAE